MEDLCCKSKLARHGKSIGPLKLAADAKGISFPVELR